MTSFKYFGATLCKDDTFAAEVRTRIASAMAAMARLNRIWWCNTISFASKFKLCESLVTPSSLAVNHGPFLLTLEKEQQQQKKEKKKRIQAIETKCLRKSLRISYFEHKTKDWSRSKIN